MSSRDTPASSAAFRTASAASAGGLVPKTLPISVRPETHHGHARCSHCRHRACQTGGRFSANARGPSRASSVIRSRLPSATLISQAVSSSGRRPSTDR